MAKSLYSIHIEDYIDRNNPFSADLPLMDTDGDHLVREVEYKDPRGLYVQNTSEYAVYVNGRFNKMRSEGTRVYIKDDENMFNIVEHAEGSVENIKSDWSLARGSQSIFKNGMDMGSATPGAVDVAVQQDLEYQKSIENEEDPVEDLDKLQEIPESEEAEEEIVEDLDNLKEVSEEKLKQEEAERKAKEEAERKAKEEAERKAKEEAERKAREEAERKQKEEAERKAREEAERKAREEAERKQKEEAERRAREEAERKAKEEAERKAREEAERRAREEAERKAREEAERKEREEAERKAKEEAERRAKEEAERKAKAEAERKAKEEAERKAKEEAERKAREEEERKEKERIAAEKKAAEDKARKEREDKIAQFALIAAEIKENPLIYGNTLEQFKRAYEARLKDSPDDVDIYFAAGKYTLVPVGDDMDITYKFPTPEECFNLSGKWAKGNLPTVWDQSSMFSTSLLSDKEIESLYKEISEMPTEELANEEVEKDKESDQQKPGDLAAKQEGETFYTYLNVKAETAEEAKKIAEAMIAHGVETQPPTDQSVSPEMKQDSTNNQSQKEVLDEINKKFDTITRLITKDAEVKEDRYYLASNADMDGQTTIDMLKRSGVTDERLVISRFDDYDALEDEVSVKLTNIAVDPRKEIVSIGFTGTPIDKCHDIHSEFDEKTGKYKDVFTQTKTEALAKELNTELNASETLAVAYIKGGYEGAYEAANNYKLSPRATYSLIHETMKQAIECGDMGSIGQYDDQTIKAIAENKGIEVCSLDTKDVISRQKNGGFTEVYLSGGQIAEVPSYQIRETENGFNFYAIDDRYESYDLFGEKQIITRDEFRTLVMPSSPVKETVLSDRNDEVSTALKDAVIDDNRLEPVKNSIDDALMMGAFGSKQNELNSVGVDNQSQSKTMDKTRNMEKTMTIRRKRRENE